MRKIAVALVVLAGCSRFGSQGLDSSRFDPAQRLSPSAFVQNATMKDTSVHEDPNLLKAGTTRDQILAAFGAPTETTTQGGQAEEIYAFNPDGSKYVPPKTYARNIAAGIFTGGLATVVRQGRIAHAEHQLTVYHLTYGPDGKVQSAVQESREAPAEQSVPVTSGASAPADSMSHLIE